MKTQLLGVAVSMSVHVIFAFILWNIGQGFSPGTGIIALDLSFEATGPMDHAGPQEESAHPSRELSTPGGAPNEAEEIPSAPEKKRPDYSKAKPLPISPKQQLLEKTQLQPI